jgi:hypothetical protein
MDVLGQRVPARALAGIVHPGATGPLEPITLFRRGRKLRPGYINSWASSTYAAKVKLRLSEVDRQDDADRDHLTGQIDTSSPLESAQNNAVFSVMVANVTAP